jgi:hypothetical protein
VLLSSFFKDAAQFFVTFERGDFMDESEETLLAKGQGIGYWVVVLAHAQANLDERRKVCTDIPES